MAAIFVARLIAARLILCRLLRRHRWRYQHDTPECGRVFRCERCGCVWGVRCGVIGR